MKTKKRDESKPSYEDMIHARIGQAMKDDSNEEKMLTVNQIETWIAVDKARKRLKGRRVISIATCVALLCVFTLTMKYYVNTETIVEAGKKEKTVSTEVNGGTVVKNNGEDAQNNTGGSSEVHTTWAGVLEASKKYPDMVVPGEMPEGYKFERLEIMISPLKAMYSITYTDSSKHKIYINESKEGESVVLPKYSQKRKDEQNRWIYFISEPEGHVATMVIKSIMLTISGDISEEEIMKLAGKIKVEDELPLFKRDLNM